MKYAFIVCYPKWVKWSVIDQENESTFTGADPLPSHGDYMCHLSSVLNRLQEQHGMIEICLRREN